MKETMVPTPASLPLRFFRSATRCKVGERIGLLLLAVLYCFAIFHVVNTATDARFNGEQCAALDISFSDASGFALCPTSSSESLVNARTAPPSSGFKDLTKGIAASLRSNDRSHRTAFAAHAGASRSVVLDLWRSAILFPFHVFW